MQCFYRPPFFLYIPQKNPSFNDKIWTIDFLSLVFSDLSTATSANGYKIGRPTNPATLLREKFPSLMRNNLFMDVNEIRVIYYRYYVG